MPPKKKNSSFVSEIFAITVVVMYMMFGSDFVIEVVDISVEALWILNCLI